jgi:hypothetical protein
MSNQLNRILPPYTRRADTLGHRLRKAAVITATIGFAIIMGFWVAIFSTLVVPMFIGVIGVLFLIAMWLAEDEEPDLSRPAAALFTAYIFLSVFWPSYLAVAIPGLPWLTPTRMALGLTAFLMLLHLSQSQISRSWIVGAIVGMKPAFAFYGLTLLLMFATVPMGRTPGDSLSFAVMQSILWNIPLIAALWLFRDPDVGIRVLRAMGIALLFVMLLTLAEYRNLQPIWVPYIPSFLKVDAAQMASTLSAQTRLDGGYRAKGTFSVHLYYAQFLLMMLPFALHWLLDSRTATSRLWAAAYLVLMLIIIWMNNTRTGTTGQLVVIAGMLALYAFRHYLHTQSALDVTAPAFLLGIPGAAAVLAVLISISPRLQTMTIGGTLHANSDAVRDGQWDKAWAAVFSNPIGHGAGDSGPLTGRLTSGGIWIVDSTWINFLVDFGVLGALSWALFLGLVVGTGALIYLQKVDRSANLAGPAAIAIGSFMMSMYTISFFGSFPMLMVLIALICATRHRLATAGLLAKPKDVVKPARMRTGPAVPATS